MDDTFALDAQPVQLADVAGFRTGAAACGLRGSGPDIGIVLCESAEGQGTAVFSQSNLRSAPVRVSSPRAVAGRARAIVLASGNAFCCTGEDGMSAARALVDRAGTCLGVGQEQVLVAACGPAGVPAPMDRIEKGIQEACRQTKENGKGDFAAVVGNGTGAKLVSASGAIGGKKFRIAGAVRCATAASPDMASMFAFVVTDVAISPACLREILIGVAHRTFAQLAVDAGAGSNDILCVLASGKTGNETIDNVFSAGVFAEALEAVAARLAAESVAEPRGRIEVRVKGAATETEAEVAARTVADSMALKVALRSLDPGWALAIAAAGRAGAKVDEAKTTVRVAGELLFEKGTVAKPPADLVQKLKGPVVKIELDLGLGSNAATAWSEGLPGGGGGGGDDARAKALERDARQAHEAAKKAEGEIKQAGEAAKKAEADAAARGKEIESLRTELKKRDDEIARLSKQLESAAPGAGEVLKTQEEFKRVSTRLQTVEAELEQAKAQASLKDQLVKQLLDEDKKKKGKK